VPTSLGKQCNWRRESIRVVHYIEDNRESTAVRYLMKYVSRKRRVKRFVIFGVGWKNKT
jgi:hypothetical protein